MYLKFWYHDISYYFIIRTKNWDVVKIIIKLEIIQPTDYN